MSLKMTLNNPYAKGSHKADEMGRQSQQRVSNTKRAFQLAQSNSFPRKKKQAQQTTMFGGIAFYSERDCHVCKAHAVAREVEGYRIPKRAHHVLCIKNTKTKGMGAISACTLETQKEARRLKEVFNTPINFDSRHLTKAAGDAFFCKKIRADGAAAPAAPSTPQLTAMPTADDFCRGVLALTSDENFREIHKNKSTPLSMLAFAATVVDIVIRPKKTVVPLRDYFVGLTMTVPACESNSDPHYHSIEGQKLLLVDWPKMYGLELKCPDSKCFGFLQNDRTNYSKNKTLFPVFGIDGPPSWCMVMSMVCSVCRRRFNANEGQVLVMLPDYAAESYPVESKFALSNKSCHLSRSATESVVDPIMLTYANGELCSRLLFNTINRAYVQKVKVFYSYMKHRNVNPAPDYIEKDSGFIQQYPPLGDTIRDMYDEACSSNLNAWHVSDHDRNTREMQSVSCEGGIFAQDHTFEVIKNYPKRIGATAVWDVATGTGEIATAVLVPTTKAKHYSHAARTLLNRAAFTPRVMYSDTWPHGTDYWRQLTPAEGRLGLFHFEKRIIRTLKKKHVDYFDAITGLLNALYSYEAGDYEALLSALKTGTLSVTDTCYTSEDIAELQATKVFRDRYSKYLRKSFRRPETMVQMIDDWFCRYKVTASPDSRPAGGRLDPYHQVPLFTSETKDAVEQCKGNAQYLTDALPLDDMYDAIPPNPNSKHGLTEYLSKRGESKLESFHDRLSNFANSGMRPSLADNLNLMGTARYNLTIRHRRNLIASSRKADTDTSQDENPTVALERRRKIPAAWERVVPYFNHSELGYVNRLAKNVGAKRAPFPDLEELPPDNGERFFSEFMTVTHKPATSRYDELGLCICTVCIAIVKNTSGQIACRPTDTVTLLPSVPMPKIIMKETPPQEFATTTITATTPRQHPQQAGWPNVVPLIGENTTFVHPTIAMAPLAPAGPPYRQLIFQPQYYYNPAPSSCCPKYGGWLTGRRVGRPPHDAHCQVRINQLRQQQQYHCPDHWSAII